MDHVTLKTEVMAAENSAPSSQEQFIFLNQLNIFRIRHIFLAV